MAKHPALGHVGHLILAQHTGFIQRYRRRFIYAPRLVASCALVFLIRRLRYHWCMFPAVAVHVINDEVCRSMEERFLDADLVRRVT